jgi:TetR/AcrR family transcriptional regulator
MARPRGGVSTKQRLLATAAAEFAARGFDGAKVDRIAARARVNKAMLYYHFPSKAGLYLAILREQFGGLGEAAASARVPGLPADEQLRRFIDAIARAAVARPTFPAIWLREIAEGGRHLDQTVVCALRRVLEALGGILDDGRRAGLFRPVNPLVLQISIVAPLMFFASSAPFRERVGRLLPAPIPAPELSDMIAHVQAATLAVVGVPAPVRREP